MIQQLHEKLFSEITLNRKGNQKGKHKTLKK